MRKGNQTAEVFQTQILGRVIRISFRAATNRKAPQTRQVEEALRS